MRSYMTITLFIFSMPESLTSFFSLPEPGQGYDRAAKKSTGNNGEEPSEDLNCRQMVKTRHFWFLLVVYIFGASATFVPINHIAMITSGQAGLTNAYIFVSILSICNCLGRLGGGWLGDKITARSVLLWIAALNCISMLLFRYYMTPIAFAIGCILAGLHCGAIMALVPVLVSKLFGAKYCAQNYGLIACIGFVNGFIGSQLAGLLADRTGNYYAAYMVCAVYLALATIAAWKLPKKK